MAVNDLFQCTFEMNVGNHPASFVLGYKQTGETGTVDDELTALCALAASGDFAGMNFYLSDACTLEAVKCRKLTGDPNPLAQVKLENARGQVSGDSIPLIKSALITHKQSTDDVRRNGKTYLPGLAESVCDQGKIIVAQTISFIETTFSNLRLTNAAIPAGTADFRMVVLSYPNGRQNPPVALDVDSSTCSNILYNSQRRRTREYGYSTIPI